MFWKYINADYFVICTLLVPLVIHLVVDCCKNCGILEMCSCIPVNFISEMCRCISVNFITPPLLEKMYAVSIKIKASRLSHSIFIKIDILCGIFSFP